MPHLQRQEITVRDDNVFELTWIMIFQWNGRWMGSVSPVVAN